jgi:hypothetical protein
MNVLFLGTANGRVYAYKLKNCSQLVADWYPRAWEFCVRGDEVRPVIAIDVMGSTGLANELKLVFAVSDRIYSHVIVGRDLQ